MGDHRDRAAGLPCGDKQLNPQKTNLSLLLGEVEQPGTLNEVVNMLH